MYNLLSLSGHTYHGISLEEIRDNMSSQLSVDGPRSLYAQGDGAEIQVSLESDTVEFIRVDGEPTWVND